MSEKIVPILLTVAVTASGGCTGSSSESISGNSARPDFQAAFPQVTTAINPIEDAGFGSPASTAKDYTVTTFDKAASMGEKLGGEIGLNHMPDDGYAVRVMIAPEVTGKSPVYVGLNQGHFMPDTNIKQWVEYSGINAMRMWTRTTTYTQSSDVRSLPEKIKTVGDFDAMKAELRKNPESQDFIKWDVIEKRMKTMVDTVSNNYQLDYALKTLSDLGIEVFAQCQLDTFNGNQDWNSLFISWQRYYAMAFLLAKNYDVHYFNFLNEPDLNSDKSDYINFVLGLQICSDAMRAAIEDVNRIYGKNLKGIFYAPELAGSPMSDFGKYSLQKIRTDYGNRPVDYNIFDLFSQHRYKKTGPKLAEEIQSIRKMMAEEHPTGEILPIIYTEFNRYNASAFHQISDDMNTPYVFVDHAGMYIAMAREGIYGMIAQKFSNTDKSGGLPAKDAVIGVKTGHYDVQNFMGFNIMGSRKAGEVLRLWAKGFKGANDLLAAQIASGEKTYDLLTSYDTEDDNYYLWSVNGSKDKNANISLDVSKLDVPAGTVLTIEEVSLHHAGEVACRIKIDDPSHIHLNQRPESVWLITIPKNSTKNRFLGTVKSSGTEPIIRINHLEKDKNIGYVQFGTSSINKKVNRAVLWIKGVNNSNDKDFEFHVYAVNNARWNGNIPDIEIDRDGRVKPTDDTFMVGSLTYDRENRYAGVDITPYLNGHTSENVTFVLIREKMYKDDNFDGSSADIDLSSIVMELTE